MRSHHVTSQVVPERYYSYAACAAYLGVSERTLFRWVKLGRVEAPSASMSARKFPGVQLIAMRNGPSPPGTFTPPPPHRNALHVSRNKSLRIHRSRIRLRDSQRTAEGQVQPVKASKRAKK